MSLQRHLISEKIVLNMVVKRKTADYLRDLTWSNSFKKQNLGLFCSFPAKIQHLWFSVLHYKSFYLLCTAVQFSHSELDVAWRGLPCCGWQHSMCDCLCVFLLGRCLIEPLHPFPVESSFWNGLCVAFPEVKLSCNCFFFVVVKNIHCCLGYFPSCW